MTAGTLDSSTVELLKARHPAVWDSRAPYFTFLDHFGDLNRFYRATRIGHQLLRNVVDGVSPSSEAGTVRSTLLGMRSDRVWALDVKKYPKLEQRTSREVLDRDLASVSAITDEVAVTRCVELFDLYLGCWLWNMLLTIAQSKMPLTAEQNTAFKKSVKQVVDKNRMPIGSKVIDEFPGAAAVLGEVDRRFTDPRYKIEPENRHAWRNLAKDDDAIPFLEMWRGVRDCIVHKGGVADDIIVRQYAGCWNIVCSDFSLSEPLVSGRKIPLRVELVMACFATLQVSALSLSTFS